MRTAAVDFPTKRKEMFCYSSPSDNLMMATGRWIDAAVPRMPGRTAARLAVRAASELTGMGPRITLLSNLLVDHMLWSYLAMLWPVSSMQWSQLSTSWSYFGYAVVTPVHAVVRLAHALNTLVHAVVHKLIPIALAMHPLAGWQPADWKQLLG